MLPISRRSWAERSGSLRRSTPDEIEGPFYPAKRQKDSQADRDFDLTRIEGSTESATGQVVWIQGRVINSEGQPLPNTVVEIWQANAAGRYRHPADSNSAPLDPNFQGWAVLLTDDDGRFRFKTIVPGSYPASRSWQRPPHIHFKVSRSDTGEPAGTAELVTQMYFESHPLNQQDLLLERMHPSERSLLIAKRSNHRTSTPSSEAAKGMQEVYEWDIVL